MHINVIDILTLAPEDGKPGDDAVFYSIVCSNPNPNVTDNAAVITLTAYKTVGSKRAKAQLDSHFNWWLDGQYYEMNPLTVTIAKGTTASKTVELVDGNNSILVSCTIAPVVNGRNSVRVDLDNEMDSVPCDCNGVVTADTTVTTRLTVYDGTDPVKSGVRGPANGTLTLAGAQNFTGIQEGVVTVSWTIKKGAVLSSDRYTANIPVTYKNVRYDSLFTLNVVKSGKAGVSPTIYQVKPSLTAITFRRMSEKDNSLTPPLYNITCGYTKNEDGNVTVVANSNGKIDSRHYIYYRLDKGSWYAYPSNVGVIIGNGTTNTSLEFCISTTGTLDNVADSNIIDRETVPIIIGGANGDDGIGIKDANIYFAVSNSGTSAPSAFPYDKISSAQFKKGYYVWQAMKITFTDGNYSDFIGAVCLGSCDDFATVTEEYAIGNKSEATSAWVSGTPPTPDKGKYLWTRTKLTYNSGETKYTPSEKGTCIGYWGNDGSDGNDGKGIKDANIFFAVNYSGTNAPADFPYDTISSAQFRKDYFVWQATKISYTDETDSGFIGAICLGSCDDFATVTEEYAIGTQSAATGSWVSGTPPTPSKGSYLWTRTKLTYNTGAAKYTPSERGTCIGYWGNDGTSISGNGIVKQSSLFLATDKKEVEEYSAADGWTPHFPKPTEQKPYVWKCVMTIYTKTGTDYSDPELLTVYQNGCNSNLLDNAAFVDDDHMDAWTTKSSYAMIDGASEPVDKGSVDSNDKVDGRNCYADTCKAGPETIHYKEVLRQIVYSKSMNGRRKIETTKWYTLSFWAKAWQNSCQLDLTSSAYGFGSRTCYLFAGRTYYIRMTGGVSQEAYDKGHSLRMYVTESIDDKTWEAGYSAVIEIYDTNTYTTKAVNFTPKVTGTYHIDFYMYDDGWNNGTDRDRTGTVTVRSYIISDSGRDLTLHLYPNMVDEKVMPIIDGEEVANDLVGGGHRFALTSSWVRHTVTFKTKSSFYKDRTLEDQEVYFRLDPATNAECYRTLKLCMPKLEAGMFATGFLDTYEDVRGSLGPMCYYAGEWQAEASYVRTDRIVPLVSHGSDRFFYYPIKVGTLKGNEPSSTNKEWGQQQKVPLLLADLLMADFGKIASAVFSGDFMISQYGKLINGNSRKEINEKCTKDEINQAYTHFEQEQPDDGDFVPNLYINFLTGLMRSVKMKAYDMEAHGGTFDNVDVSGFLKAKLFYGGTYELKDSDYSTFGGFVIDPKNNPATTYLLNNPGINSLVKLPNAADWEGLEIKIVTFLDITVFTRVGSPSVTVKCVNATDGLWIPNNTISTEIDGKHVSLQKNNTTMKDYKGQGIELQMGGMYIFKSIHTYNSGWSWVGVLGAFGY